MGCLPGAQVLLDDPGWSRRLAGMRYALLCHQASVDQDGHHVFDRLCADPVLRPEFLLVPEHGLFGEAIYMEPVADCVDARLGVPVRSLYGDSVQSLALSASWLDGVDAVVCDLQDVGARYYTYAATMAMAMDACAAAGVAFVVADRPNPIGGCLVEGNRVLPVCQSFVGHLSVPNRHGMTVGELAHWHARTTKSSLDLTVIACPGWSRNLQWLDTGLPFVPPSPNIPNWETALVYPGMCLLEGTNLSEGRGTTLPFFLLGAPYVTDPWEWAQALDAERVPGVAWRPTYFCPGSDKWAGQRCGAVQLIVRDAAAFRPLQAGLAVLVTARRLYPEAFEWRREAYEFVRDRLAIDLLLGNPAVRAGIEAGACSRDLASAMQTERDAFVADREPDLLYGKIADV